MTHRTIISGGLDRAALLLALSGAAGREGPMDREQPDQVIPVREDGKDHWLVTSALIVGGPVKPGVYGGTDERLSALPVDLRTGKLDAGGALIDYDCFVAGILRMCRGELESCLPNVTPLEGFIA